MRPRRLKLGTHENSGEMFHVYQNQAAAAYSSLYFFIFFLSNFQTLKSFVTLLSGTVRPRRLKLWYTRGQWADVSYIPESVCCCLFILLFLHFSFSPIFNIEIFHHTFSGTVRLRRLKLGTHLDSGEMYCIYRNQAAAAYSSLNFFILQYSNIKNFCHTFLGNCEA